MDEQQGTVTVLEYIFKSEERENVRDQAAVALGLHLIGRDGGTSLTGPITKRRKNMNNITIRDYL